MPWREIEAFLRRKERWIVAKLDEWSRSPRPSVLHGESGETLPLFGKTVVVNVHEGARAVKWQSRSIDRPCSALARAQDARPLG